MNRQGTFHFYPKRIAWLGLIILALGSLYALPDLWQLQEGTFFPVRKSRKIGANLSPLRIALGLSDTPPTLAIPEMQEKMTFSFDPPRPNSSTDHKQLFVHLKGAQLSRRIDLPCRLDLEFQGDQIAFAKESSLFWAEISMSDDLEILVKTFITTLEGKTVEAGRFTAFSAEKPIQNANEFPEGSPFRCLADAKWWGRDLFKEVGAAGERIEIGTAELLELKNSEWLVFEGGSWKKTDRPDQHLPIAHILSESNGTFVLEGWDGDEYVKLSPQKGESPPFKMRAEELITSIRIRSEKQISCMIEKQCMVVKTGDWVLKNGSRWKVIRKKEEKESFLNGKLYGKLFILDQISQRQGQKVIQGHLFNSDRTQLIPVEIAAKPARMPKEIGGKIGKRL